MRGGLLAVALFVLGIGLGFPGVAEAKILTVTTTGDPGPPGTLSLRQAIDQSDLQGTDTVVVPPGRYRLKLRLIIYKTVAIEGAGAEKTIIDGDGGGLRQQVLDIDGFVPRALSVTVSGVTITGGANQGFGGGIFTSGDLTLIDSVVRDNVVSGNGGAGGGIYVGGDQQRQVTIIRSTITRNAAVDRLLNDTVAGRGGGLYVQSGRVALIDSTVSENFAFRGQTRSGSGGGVAVEGFPSQPAALTVDGSTIADNFSQPGTPGSADSGGGNVFARGSTLVFRNSIVADGSGPSGQENCVITADVAFTSLPTNLDSRDQCGFHGNGIVNADPDLGPIEDNGGPTLTLAPALGSPAIDAAATAGCLPTDQRGVSRPQGAACDIGAFEAGGPAVDGVAVTRIGSRSATLKGTMNPLGANGAFRFEYGRTSAYGHAEGNSLSPLVGPAPVSARIRRLRAHTTYHFRLKAMNPYGSSASADVAFRTASAPRVRGLRVSPRRFRLRSRRATISRLRTGTRISFRLTRSARLTLEFLKRSSGRRVGRRCQRPTRANRGRASCTRLVRVGAVRFRARAGRRTIRFRGQLSGRRKLTPGRYRLRLAATDADGSTTRTRPVRIVALR